LYNTQKQNIYILFGRLFLVIQNIVDLKFQFFKKERKTEREKSFHLLKEKKKKKKKKKD